MLNEYIFFVFIMANLNENVVKEHSVRVKGNEQSKLTIKNNNDQNKNPPLEPVNPADVPERLYCGSCRTIMCNPFVIRTCGHNVCNVCVLDLTGNGSQSGHCSGDGNEMCDIATFSMADVIPDVALKRDIRDIKIFCPNKHQGCTEEITYGNLEEHRRCCAIGKLQHMENGALLEVIKQLQNDLCSIRAAIKAESQKQSKTVNSLEKEMRTLRENNKTQEKQIEKLLATPRKDQQVQLNNLKQDLDQLTENGGSAANKLSFLETSALEGHRGEGTNDTTRNNLKKMMEKIGLHGVILTDYDIRLQCLENATFDGRLVWKIANVTGHMDNARSGKTLSLFSQPFYTSMRGYKLCGRVYLNGDGQGKGNYVSVYLVIMRGTYDELQKWPFQRKITLGAIDVNTKGKNNKQEAFNPDPSSSSFKKPESEMNIACGCPKFLSHKDLFSGSYIKDDTVYLTIDVD